MLAAGLILGEADVATVTDKSSWSLANIMPEVYEEILTPLAQDDGFKMTTIENTLAKFGKDADLGESLYGTILSVATGMIRAIPPENVTWTGDATYIEAAGYVDDIVNRLKELDDKAEDAELINMLGGYLKSDTLFSTVNVRLQDTPDYTAVMLSTDGVKFFDTATITVNSENAVVILLGDVNKLTVNGKNTIVNLNGKTLNEIKCTASNDLITDSAQGEDSVGTVKKVSGGILTAGCYPNGKGTGTIEDGYILNADKKVVNEFYTIEKTSDGFDITLDATMDAFKAIDKGTAIAIAVDIAADVLFNYYTAQALTVDGNGMYTADIENIADLFRNGKLKLTDAYANQLIDEDLHLDNIVSLINSIIAGLCDFGGLADSIDEGAPIFSYDIATKGWFISVARDTAENYLKLGVIGKENHGLQQKLNIYVDSKNSGDQNNLLSTLEFLDEVVTWDTVPAIGSADINIAGHDVTVLGNGSAAMTIDLSQDPNYALAAGLVIASKTKNASLKAELIEGIETYFGDNVRNIEPLKKAMEKVTIKEAIKDLKALPESYTFASLAKGLSLSADAKAGFTAADSLKEYRNGIAVMGLILRNADISLGDSPLGSMATADYGVYRYSRENVQESVTKTVRDPWSVTVDATLISGSITLKLFSDFHLLQLTSDNGEGQSVATVSGGGAYRAGVSVKASAPDVTGYEFRGWFNAADPETLLSAEQDYIFVMPDEDVDLVAMYLPDTNGFLLTVKADNGQSFKIAEEAYDTEETKVIAPNSRLTLTYTGKDTLLYWVNGSDKVVGTDSSIDIVLTSNMTYRAVTIDSKTVISGAQVVFLSAFNQVLYSQYHTTADVAGITIPTVPGNMGHTFTGWQVNAKSGVISDATQLANTIKTYIPLSSGAKHVVTVTAKYTESEDAYVVKVNFEGVEHDPATYDAAAGVITEIGIPTINGYTFSHWKDAEGNIFSTSKTIYVRTLEDLEWTAVYVPTGTAPETPRPMVAMVGSYAAVNGEKYRVSFTALRSAPQSYNQKIVEAGFLYSTTVTSAEELILNAGTTPNAGVKKALTAKYNTDSFETDVMTLNINTSDFEKTFYVRGFVTYDNGNTVYSNIWCGSAESLGAEAIDSE